MRKTILARILGAAWPQTHAADFPINPESAFLAYGGARGGKVYRAQIEAEAQEARRRLEVYWWLALAKTQGVPGSYMWERGDQNTSTMPADPWKSLTRDEILSDIKKLGETCYGVCKEVEEIFNRMKGQK